MQSEFKFDNNTLQIITNTLLYDIFTPNNNRNIFSPNDIDEEETKVFYPTDKRRATNNELAMAFVETINGDINNNNIEIESDRTSNVNMSELKSPNDIIY